MLKHLCCPNVTRNFIILAILYLPLWHLTKSADCPALVLLLKSLLDEGAKALVIACTLLAAAADELRATYPHVPIMASS